jgi:hypothetical protein
MLAKLIALLVLSSALAVLGQDETTHTTYPRNLDQEPVRGRIIGAIDGDTIKSPDSQPTSCQGIGNEQDGLHRTRFKRSV